HGDWSLSPAYKGPLPDTRFMDIDSAASTPILGLKPDLSDAQYLHYELTALAYHLVGARDWGLGAGRLERTSGQLPRASQPSPTATASPEPLAPSPDPRAREGFSALIIGPGGGR